MKLLAEEEQAEFLKEDAQAPPRDSRVRKVGFESVSFSFPEGKEVIRDLSVEIDLGRKTAIIGEVGAGKSVFLRLLLGELCPTSGKIMVEFASGERRDLWTKSTYEAYRRQLASVPQEAFVSSDLFENNIALVDSTSEAVEGGDMMQAAYWAELEADLSSFAKGMKQEIGESGVNLSGGQKQRLNLARARFFRRSYMVLDDTLSAVDAKTESALMDHLCTMKEGFLLVTHRTGELMRVGEVLVMKDGYFVERGDPAVLSERGDSYFTRVLRAYDQTKEASLV